MAGKNQARLPFDFAFDLAFDFDRSAALPAL
jgi:hypothetical protein